MDQPSIGIFGGTFDPIHLGHIHLATEVYSLCGLQKILLVPCFQSPHRPLPAASAKDRLHMVQLAIKDLPFLEAEDYEVRHQEVSYAIDTLVYLRKKYTKTSLALIMGIDAFNRFHEWHEWRKILDLANLIVVKRKNHELTMCKETMVELSKRQVFTALRLQKKPSGLIYLADVEPLPIAATEFRNLIKKQEDASHLVPKKVWQYILDNNLYTERK